MTSNWASEILCFWWLLQIADQIFHSILDIFLWFSQTTVQNWTQDDENEWEIVYTKIKNQKIS